MSVKTPTERASTKAHRIQDPVRPRLCTVKQASAYMGIPVWAVRSLIWKGFPFIRLGHTMYLDVRDLDAFIDREKQTYEI